MVSSVWNGVWSGHSGLQVLSLVHHHHLSGHLGIRKTHDRVLLHFLCPGFQSDVARYCRSCLICLTGGKLKKLIPPASSHPIRIWLSRTKDGLQYVLITLYVATRFPEATLLRSLRAKPVVKALVKFFSTFDLPKCIQTDHRSNFISVLGIKHKVSSACQLESQGVLEGLHMTLKSMQRKRTMPPLSVEEQKQYTKLWPGSEQKL